MVSNHTNFLGRLVGSVHAGWFAPCAAGGGTALQLLNSWRSSWRGIGLVAIGSAFEATPFRAVQVAAWETLART